MATFLLAVLLFLLSGCVQRLVFGAHEGTQRSHFERGLAGFQALCSVDRLTPVTYSTAFLVLPELSAYHMRIVVPLLRPDPAMKVQTGLRPCRFSTTTTAQLSLTHSHLPLSSRDALGLRPREAAARHPAQSGGPGAAVSGASVGVSVCLRVVLKLGPD